MSAAAELLHTPPALGRGATVRPTSGGFINTLAYFTRNHPVAGLGTLMLVFFVFMAIFAPQIAPQDPLAQNVQQQFREPSGAHWFGTDTFGRDVFSRVVFGSRISLFVGLVSVLAATVAGTLLGVTSAYARGLFDLFFQRF